MEINAMVLLDIWDLFSDHIPSSKKNDIAIKFFEILINNDIDLDDLEDLRGEDSNIDFALDHLDNLVIDKDEEHED